MPLAKKCELTFEFWWFGEISSFSAHWAGAPILLDTSEILSVSRQGDFPCPKTEIALSSPPRWRSLLRKEVHLSFWGSEDFVSAVPFQQGARSSAFQVRRLEDGRVRRRADAPLGPAQSTFDISSRASNGQQVKVLRMPPHMCGCLALTHPL